MDNEALIDDTITNLLDGLQDAFGIELSTEDLNEVREQTKVICAELEASRPKSTKSKSKN